VGIKANEKEMVGKIATDRGYNKPVNSEQ